MIIKTRKGDPHAEGGVRILIKESDRDESSLEKSLTDNELPKICKKIHDLLISVVPSNASACQRNKHFGF